MDGISKLSDYDIFGYLAPGLVLFAICDISFGTTLFTDMTVATGAFVLIAAYVLGHATAAAATLLWDRIIVRSFLGMPTSNLMAKSQKWRVPWRKWLLSGYYDPLPSTVRERVITRAGFTVAQVDAAPNDGWGEKVFARAWPVIKRDPVPYARMDSFLRLYGFCRNISFVAFVMAVVFWINPPTVTGVSVDGALFGWTALAVSVVMFHRYLKFFRLYSFEVFSTYAEPAPAAP
jgi:hypothetical protein